MQLRILMTALAVAVTLGIGGRSPAAEPFTIAVFPDTQNFAMNHPEIYDAMCAWIVENREERNIVFASHVGDIVNDDTPEQWANARRSHDILSAADLPYGMAIGNHDFDEDAPADILGKRYLENFGPDALYDRNDTSKGRFKDQPWWGGHSPTGLSSYQLLDPQMTGGVPLLFLNIEVDLRESEVDWAGSIVQRHPGRIVIISTHRYVYDYRIIRGRFEPFIYENVDRHYTDESVGAHGLFERVIKPSPNVMMVWCGHVDGEYRRQSTNDAGLPVFELLQDFQSLSPRGGDGWLRLYEFDPGAGEIRVETFSPVVDGGRLRTQRDQARELFALVERASEGMGRPGPDMPFRIEDIDPQIRALLAGSLAQPGAMSEFVESVRTGEGRFAPLVNSMIDSMAGQNAGSVRRVIGAFPFDAITPGLIELMDREGAPAIRALLDGDSAAVLDFWREDDHRRVIEGFFAGDTRDPSFTLEVDFGAYLEAAGERNAEAETGGGR